ncbi:MAG: hypothetical protein MHPSP_004021, partial [Paramarteilia canceri]
MPFASAKVFFERKWRAINAKFVIRERLAEENFNNVKVVQLNDHFTRKKPSFLKKSRVIVRNLPTK